MRAFILLGLALVGTVGLAQAPSAGGDWSGVERALGRTGKAQAGGVYKFGLPRGDMKVTADGVAIKPTLALGSWLAFTGSGSNAMVMGDLVLSEEEVSPVMLALTQGGLEVTALHNHVLHETPRVMYMHVSGHGDAVKLATTLHDAIALTGTPGQTQGAAQGPLEIDQAQVESALGYKGAVNGGVLQVSVPRAEKVMEGGMEIPPSMGTATALNFQPTGGGKAAITGDFVLIGSEVNPVVRVLRLNGIQVTAIHSHMLDEEPRLFFMHFWANDDAVKLAKGLRAAVDVTNSKKP